MPSTSFSLTFDTLISFIPTNKKELERNEYLQKHIDFDEGKEMKTYLERQRKKLLFKMTTNGMNDTPLNHAIFDFVVKNPDLGNCLSWRLTEYFKLEGSQLMAVEKRSIKIKVKLYYIYWWALVVLSFLTSCGVIYKYHDSLLYSTLGCFAFIIMTPVGFIMIGNKQRTMNFIKQFKKRNIV
ncbi:MAG: hypothetical protein F8N35_13005 [Paludibacter sp.]|nr:hypothetical protein [Paludibacter sp.]